MTVFASFSVMFNAPTGFDMNAGGGVPPQWPTGGNQVNNDVNEGMDGEDADNARRPPNAFILYSQAMRSQVRQENPSLSNTECSRLLGKMWKEVPNDMKLQYKQKAASMQEDFKREHPDYTYRKARRKRALNELLTKSTQGYTPMVQGFPTDMQAWQGMMAQGGNPAMFSMGGGFNPQQPNPMSFGMGGFPPGQMPGMGPGQGMFSMQQFQPK